MGRGLLERRLIREWGLIGAFTVYFQTAASVYTNVILARQKLSRRTRAKYAQSTRRSYGSFFLLVCSTPFNL